MDGRITHFSGTNFTDLFSSGKKCQSGIGFLVNAITTIATKNAVILKRLLLESKPT